MEKVKVPQKTRLPYSLSMLQHPKALAWVLDVGTYTQDGHVIICCRRVSEHKGSSSVLTHQNACVCVCACMLVQESI